MTRRYWSEKIERNDALERLRARQRRAVEQGQRVAIAQAAHVDEAVADHAQARHATKCAGDIAFAGPGDVLREQHRHDRRGSALDIAATTAGHHDRTAGHGDVRRLFCRRFFRGWASAAEGRVGSRRRDRLCKRSRRDQCRRQEQQARKLERRRHRKSPYIVQFGLSGGRQPVSRIPPGRVRTWPQVIGSDVQARFALVVVSIGA